MPRLNTFPSGQFYLPVSDFTYCCYRKGVMKGFFAAIKFIHFRCRWRKLAPGTFATNDCLLVPRFYFRFIVSFLRTTIPCFVRVVVYLIVKYVGNELTTVQYFAQWASSDPTLSHCLFVHYTARRCTHTATRLRKRCRISGTFKLRSH